MTSQHDPLEVIVQGGPTEANAVVYGVVQAALAEAGFTEVTVHSPQGDVEAIVGEIPSMLDLLRANRPALFDTPIAVRQNAHAEEVIALSVSDPDDLGIARVVYNTSDVLVEETVAHVAPEPDDFTEVTLIEEEV